MIIEMGYTSERINFYMDALSMNQMASLDADVNEKNGEIILLKDLIPDPSNEDRPDEQILVTSVEDDLDHALVGELTPRERGVIRLRYGFDDQQAKTLKEAGKEMGVSRERVRQIEAKAFKKLRKPQDDTNKKLLESLSYGRK